VATRIKTWIDPHLPPARLRRAGEAEDLFHIAFDPIFDLIRGHARGCWSVRETAAYLDGLAAFVTDSRQRLGRARVLLDRRDVSAQSAEVAQLLAEGNRTIFAPSDKIALVVDSSLNKMSLRRRMPHPGTKAFLSIDAAATWLAAF
jgi:hypothetical protein